MATGVIVAEVISLAFSLVLTLWLKTAGKLKRPGWFLLYVLSINALALIIAFAVDSCPVASMMQACFSIVLRKRKAILPALPTVLWRL